MAKSANILLGVCGGVAAYKSAELLRALQREGMEVRVVMTRAAQEFVRPLTFASLSGHRVFTDLWASSAEDEEGKVAIEHIEQAQWADVVLVAPATAHTMAKFCHGLADDFLSATYLATEAPVVLAPAMNVNMWNHEATRENRLVLQQRGHRIVEPGSGFLACGMTGEGRFAETDAIVGAVVDALDWRHDFAGETVLVTAGGTREPIDAVRFIGNHSSGKMGYALAAAAQRRGARVILVSAATGLPVPVGCEWVGVGTAAEMHTAVLREMSRATVVLKAAAVSDFRVVHPVTGKLERSEGLRLELTPTDDIVLDIVKWRRPGTLVVAFAAEAGLNVERARAKLRAKGADAIVLNDIIAPGVGFGADRNAVVLLTESSAVEIPEADKNEVAEGILDEVLRLRCSLPVESEAVLQSH
jgi:phosphopantothenoylcysteine decarboxylase / phosphopantothenate---cysteine ligase